MEPTLGTAICLDKSPCGKVVLSHIQVKEHQTRQLEIAPAAMQAVRDLKLEDSESQASLGCKPAPATQRNQSIKSNVYVDNLRATCGFCVSCIYNYTASLTCFDL